MDGYYVAIVGETEKWSKVKLYTKAKQTEGKPEADKVIVTFDNLRLAVVQFNKNPIKLLLSIPLEYDDSEAQKKAWLGADI